MTAAVLAVYVLAVYRLTLLVTHDEITRPLRHRFADWSGGPKHRLAREVVSGEGPDRVWLRAECPCGFTVEAPPEGPAEQMAVLAEFNDHLNGLRARREVAHPFVYRLHDCPWCVSVWLAAPAAWATMAWSSGWGWWVVAGGLAASGVAGFLAHFAVP